MNSYVVDEDRAALVARWLRLTRETLPGMAACNRWPIRLDHCFMRVFLDQVVGSRWDRVVRRPAIRFMPLPDLKRAIELAEAVIRDPDSLQALNAQSLAWRAQRRLRAGAAGVTRGGV